jgi:hypothetical protein
MPDNEWNTRARAIAELNFEEAFDQKLFTDVTKSLNLFVISYGKLESLS